MIVIMVRVNMLRVIMLSVIMLNVMIPWNHAKQSISNISRKQNVGLVTSSTILLHHLIIILSTSKKEKKSQQYLFCQILSPRSTVVKQHGLAYIK
jgi:hypothetical protein